MILILTALLTVTDGDTLRHDDLRIRLYGIDAPELREPGGPEAKVALQMLLSEAVAIACIDHGPDRYRRTVAECVFVGGPDDGRDVACVMVGLGHAVDWPRYSNGKYEGCAE